MIDLDFDIFFTEFLKGSAGVYTFLFISKIHPNTEIRDQNLSPSKIVTFLYVGTRHWSDVVVFAVGSCPLGTHLSRSSKRKNKKKFGVSIIVAAYFFFRETYF